MSLEIRKSRNGSWRRIWYGAYELEGKRYAANLGIKIAGNPPESRKLRDRGDEAFERSRYQAEVKLAEIVREARDKSGEIHLVEKIYEMKTGTALGLVMLHDLADEWERIPRKQKPTARYIKQSRARLDAFVAYVLQHHKAVRDISGVTPRIARAYMQAAAERNISPKTWNDTLKLLRTAFQHVILKGMPNAFEGIPTRTTHTLYRSPYTPEELKRIIDTAKQHDFIRPIISTGICTAMRLGDCCSLQWADVDLLSGFLTVKTSKTGQPVEIPILPLLHEELSSRPRVGQYVFPEQLKMYRGNATSITRRVKKVILEALSIDTEGEEMPPELSDAERRERVYAYLDGLNNIEKAAKMRRVFDLYLDGITWKEISAAVGYSTGTLTAYLREIEVRACCRIIRGRSAKRSISARLKDDTGLLQQPREDGQRRASIRDFHSFRVTWVTLALTAGMPLEMVQKVTGHRTAEIVLKHYFKPGREHFRNAIELAMPKLLTESPGEICSMPPADYGEDLGKAIALLEEVECFEYREQLKEVKRLMVRAKQGYDSSILRASSPVTA